jgi:hypothetical protein
MELILCDSFGKLDPFTVVNIFVSLLYNGLAYSKDFLILLPNIILGLAPRVGSNKTFYNFLRPLF